MRISFMFVLSFAAALSNAQTPRWRYVEVPNPYGREGVFFGGLNDQNQITWNETGVSPMKRGGIYSPTAGWITAPHMSPPPGSGPPNPYGPAAIASNGLTVSSTVQGLASWMPGQAPVIHRTGNWSARPTYATNASNHRIVSFRPDQSDLELFLFYRPGIDPYLMAGQDGSYGRVVGMTDSGIIAGSTGGNSFFSRHRPVYWTHEGTQVTYLNSPGQLYGAVKAISPSGKMFGVVSKGGSQPGWYGTWWSATGVVERQEFMYGYTQFYGPEEDFGTDVRASMADDGSVLYSRWENGQSRPVYYSPMTGHINMSDVVEGLPAGATLLGLHAMNNGKRMLGQLATGPNPAVNRIYSFYLEPVPEPATLAALGIGTAALLKRRKSKNV